MIRFEIVPSKPIHMRIEPTKVVLAGDAPIYEGPYEVTPKVDAQTMPTKDKCMRENMEIHGVPYFETTNTAGGNTVYIAKEIE